MGMKKSGFAKTVRGIALGAAFVATALAAGCDDYNGSGTNYNTGAGGYVQCVTTDAGATGGYGGTTRVDGSAGTNGMTACNPNGTAGTTGSGGTTGAGNRTGTGTTPY